MMKTIFGIHPERNNNDFKETLYKIIFSESRNSQLVFEKKINELMNSEHISYKTTKKYLKNCIRVRHG